MASERKTTWIQHKDVRAVTLVVPTVRMVVIEAWVHDGTSGPESCGIEILPVLALQVSASDLWSKNCPYNRQDSIIPGTIEEREAAGWCLEPDGYGPRPEALILDGEIGIVPYDDPMRQSSNLANKLMLCPWPPEQDGVALQPRIEALTKEIWSYCECRRLRELKETPT